MLIKKKKRCDGISWTVDSSNRRLTSTIHDVFFSIDYWRYLTGQHHSISCLFHRSQSHAAIALSHSSAPYDTKNIARLTLLFSIAIFNFNLNSINSINSTSSPWNVHQVAYKGGKKFWIDRNISNSDHAGNQIIP